MDLTSIYYFAELSKDLHMTNTARRLYISQQTLSNHIARLEEELGGIEEGKKADLAILNLREPQLMPWNNKVSALCYSANGSEVETVLVDGEILLENREFKTIDAERVYFEAQRRAERLGEKTL